MPILARTAAQCLGIVEQRTRHLVAQTLTPAYLAMRPTGTGLGELTFLKGRPVLASIDTRYGRVCVGITQLIGAVRRDRDKFYRPVILGYWYRLQLGEAPGERAFLRWEFDPTSGASASPRHHMHVAGRLDPGVAGPVAAGETLGKLHLATGNLPLEEFIRFCIAELGAAPPCGATWPEVLAESERELRDDFSGGPTPGGA